MTITIRIGTSERQLETLRDLDEQWVNEQINRRRVEGQSICVQVRISSGEIGMLLSTPDCSGGGGGRRPNDRESAVLELWEQRQLNQENFTGGNLIAFLRQLGKLL